VGKDLMIKIDCSHNITPICYHTHRIKPLMARSSVKIGEEIGKLSSLKLSFLEEIERP